MTVAELIEILEGCDPDAEVRMAEQPAWAFAYETRAAIPYRDSQGYDYVYLVEGNQIEYLDQRVSRLIGWSKNEEEEE